MDRLDRIQQDARHVCKALGSNPALERALRSKRAKSFRKYIYSAMLEQANDVVTKKLFSLINSKLGKAISPEDAEKEIQEIRKAIDEVWKGLGIYASPVFFKEYYKYVYETGGQYFLDAYNIPHAFDLTNEKILFGLEGRADLIIKSVDDTTKEWLANQIDKTRAGEFTFQESTDIIMEKIPGMSENRSMTIVRTETNNMVNKGENETARNNGATHKAWMTVGDDRVSDMDAMNEGEGIVGIDHIFSSGDEIPPSHPNCRCTLEYQFAPYQSFVWYGQ